MPVMRTHDHVRIEMTKYMQQLNVTELTYALILMEDELQEKKYGTKQQKAA